MRVILYLRIINSGILSVDLCKCTTDSARCSPSVKYDNTFIPIIITYIVCLKNTINGLTLVNDFTAKPYLEPAP